jgi:hypothetical protein
MSLTTPPRQNISVLERTPKRKRGSDDEYEEPTTVDRQKKYKKPKSGSDKKQKPTGPYKGRRLT